MTENTTDTTPTRAVVRGHYAWKSSSVTLAKDYAEAGAEFDRFMAEHVTTAEADRRVEAMREAAVLAINRAKNANFVAAEDAIYFAATVVGFLPLTTESEADTR